MMQVNKQTSAKESSNSLILSIAQHHDDRKHNESLDDSTHTLSKDSEGNEILEGGDDYQ